VRAREAERTEGIRERLGLGIELVPESEEDGQRAKLVEFGSLQDGQGVGTWKPLFKADDTQPNGDETQHSLAGSKTALSGERKRRLLEQQLRGNTRAAQDPFNVDKRSSTATTAASNDNFSSIKRSRAREANAPEPERNTRTDKVLTAGSSGSTAQMPTTLVAYDSD